VIQTAVDNGMPKISPVLDLTHGGKGIMAIAPIQRDGKKEGFVYGVISVDDVFPLFFDPVFKQHYDCAIYEGKHPIYATESSLKKEELPSATMVQKIISVRGLRWEMMIWPKDSVAGYVALWVLILGVVVSAMLAALMWMFSGLSEQEELGAAQREISHILSTGPTLKNIFRVVGDICLRIMGVDRCGIFIWHELERRFEPAWISSDDEEDIRGFLNLRLPYGNLPLIDRLADEKQSVLAYDKAAQALISHSPQPTFKVRTLLAVPILKDEKIAGAVTLACLDRKRRFSKQERNWLEGIANQLAINLECSRLDNEAQKQAANLTQRESELDSLVALVTADLRSPLISLQSMVSMLKNDCGHLLSADGKYYLARIQTNLSRLESLIDGAMQFSRLRERKH
jgi:GAF domain-containing protein